MFYNAWNYEVVEAFINVTLAKEERIITRAWQIIAKKLPKIYFINLFNYCFIILVQRVYDKQNKSLNIKRNKGIFISYKTFSLAKDFVGRIMLVLGSDCKCFSLSFYKCAQG